MKPLIPRLLIALALLCGALFLAIPLIAILAQAFAKGAGSYLAALADPDTVHALKLTLLVAALTIPVNLIFGAAFAWLVTRFRFKGRAFLITLLDIPFAVSPVIAGLLYLILYGNHSPIGQFFAARDMQIMFAWPGIVLVTIFVTCPFVARELIPFMQQNGSNEEEAAVTLGANTWQLWRHITLPAILWPLIYGVALTNARAIGEFGGASIVSGSIRGETQTLPLNVQTLYEGYDAAAAFASASLLAALAFMTLLLKIFIEHRQTRKETA